MTNIKVIAFDLDGTLTQHKSKLSKENRAELERLSKKYKLLMVGAGQCRRIFDQMEHFPIDIIGNYGMQYAKYDENTKDIVMVRDEAVQTQNKQEIEQKITALRQKHGFTEFKGDNVEYHPSGCLTFPILGTKADINDKLAFDPDRKKRRAFYSEVVDAFPDYVVFVGGSSSFDMAPKPLINIMPLTAIARKTDLSIVRLFMLVTIMGLAVTTRRFINRILIILPLIIIWISLKK